MRRAMQVLDGLGPQESKDTYFYPYDHPYFGQIFLASLLKIVGYPDSLSPKVGDVHSIEMLYLVPRVLMGLLAVADTFLIYKIAEIRYGRNVAFFAGVFFAVMPLSLLTRGILLDSLLLPFVLASILFALYSQKISELNRDNLISSRNILVLISGIFMGLAIFTKIPVFTMMPVIAFIILEKNNKKLKTLGLWLVPVILIPLIWPASALFTGHFSDWMNGVLWQTSRESSKDLHHSIELIFLIDPILLVLSIIGFIYSELKGNYFIFLWVVPFVVFLSILGWVVHFHWILMIPVFCIISSLLIEGVVKKIRYKRLSQVAGIVLITSISFFGLTSTISLISSNLNSAYFELYSFINQQLMENTKSYNSSHENKVDDEIAVVGTHRVKALLWIPEHVFDNDKIVWRDTDIGAQKLLPPIENKKIIIIVDPNLRNRIIPYETIGNDKDKQISWIYRNADAIATFINRENNKYEYMGMQENYVLGTFVEVRSNY
ncbi:MAG: hypothetical protein DA328_05860 [Nitrososphaeraceae archaeon]|nr:hypothetical protein [Nitrososphaeraceae archaeon]